jgi:lysophospholipase L1-like esterase
MSRRKKILFTIIFTAISLTILNAVAKRLARHPAEIYYEKVYTSHPTRVYTLKPNAQATVQVGVFGQYVAQWKDAGATYDVRINPQGWRDRPFGAKTGLRIAALGDSTTFGWDVNLEDGYPKLLESLLRAQGRNVEVLNLGIPGYSSHQGVLMMPEVWKLAPDVLIVAWGRNDELDSNHSPTEYGRGRTDAEIMPGDRIVGPPPPTLAQRIRELTLFKAGESMYFRFIHNKPPAPGGREPADHARHRVPVEQYQENLRTIIRQAKARGVKVVLVNVGCFFEKYRLAMIEVAREENVAALNTFPLLFAKVNEIKTAPRFAACRRQLIQWLGVKTLDSSSAGWLWFSTDFGHPNACGHQVIAEALAPLIPLPTTPKR